MSSASGHGGGPTASIPRMIFSPIIRVFRVLRLPLPTNIPTSPTALFTPIVIPLIAALKRLDLSTDPKKQLAKLSRHTFTPYNSFPYVLMGLLAIWTIYLIPSLALQLLIPIAYTISILLPITGQFTFPATPVFSWLLLFFTARYIPSSWRPAIHVVLLPTLESVLYGANISDILTRFTHPVLDICAWLPYGLGHFAIPFVIAAILWVFAPKGTIQFFAKAFGALNISGVAMQLLLPCAAPWYEIIHGLTPADYGMSGSPGGLMRIDRIFHSSGYTNTFGNAPLVFGAFPSLHSGCATIEALFLTHFFPRYKYAYWAYAGTLYWATMYLTHHYLIDVVGGSCMAIAWFYYLMPKEFKDLETGITWEGRENGLKPVERRIGARDYELVEEEEDDLDEQIRRLETPNEAIPSSSTSTETIGQDLRTPLEGGSIPYPPTPQDFASRMAYDDEPPPGSARASKVKPKRKRSVQWGEAEVMNSHEGLDENGGDGGTVEEGRS